MPTRLIRFACCTLFVPTVLSGLVSDGATAKKTQSLDYDVAKPAGANIFDRPPTAPALQRRAPGDTLSFGYVDEDGFAVPGGIWTFDNGGSDPFEGWYATDVTEQSEIYWRHITDAIWDADPEHTVEAPVLSGSGSAWCGALGSEARELCWEAGLGYGNNWCQRLISPVYTRPTLQNIAVSWVHFNDTETDFDYTRVVLRTQPSGAETVLRQYTGMIGLAPDHPASPPVGVTDSDVLTPDLFDGEDDFQVIFEMTSEGTWSDEDALSPTEYGPGAFDDVDVGGNLTDFEDPADIGPGGWSAEACPGVGSFFGVADVANYTIEDACNCRLAGNVLEFHDDNFEHPYGQRVEARSAPVDLTGADIPGPGLPQLFARWSQYNVLPHANGVFYRPGWDYFPFDCDGTIDPRWSGRVGQNAFQFFGEDPNCSEYISSATTTDAVPGDVELVRFVYEVYASCDAFAIPPEVCTNMTNATPLVDNVRILFTEIPDAPPISFDNGVRFQDGFAQNTVVNKPDEPGNADVTKNRNFGIFPPIILGDSLYISGPLAGSDPSTQWEARLWFRVPRVGPAADSRYTDWRDKVADGNDVENGGWTWAFMDSFQVGTNTANNKYVSYFREDDDDFDPGAGEQTEGNEIIADGVLFPGTQVEYFVTSNYVGNSQKFLLPDTSGGFALEFEILPRWRDDGGTLKYPCALYVDVFNAGAQYFIERALDKVGVEYDRYDYLDASSSWKAPMYRSNTERDTNGGTLAQFLGYRAILLNTGTSNVTSLMWTADYVMMSDWLTAEICEGASSRQGLILNGNGIANSAKTQGPALLTLMGTSHVDDRYSDWSGDLNDCVRLEAPSAGGESYGTENSTSDYEYDAAGNWCPIQMSFDVLGTRGSGVGNRVYLNVSDLETETPFAQVTNERLDGDNFRTVVGGASWHVLSEVDPLLECVSDSAHIVTAAANEIAAALEWVFGVGNIPGLCEDPCTTVDAQDGGEVTRNNASGVTTMLGSRPNPYNQRTHVRFALGQSGQARVSIFDASGRRVRTLVDGSLDAGVHSLVWDGEDDRGSRLPSGVYWARIFDGVNESSAKLVRLD